MPRSSLSLDSLSSPSPSPSPPPQGPALEAPRKPTTPADQPTTGLDSDSELSELTDEEQDAAEKRTTTSTAMPDEEDDDGAGITGGSRSKSTSLRQGGQQRPSNRRGGRKKRSSIVPAPMWGWAENKTSTVVQEEEEEDAADPPRAMEEEEDEDMRQEEEEECEGEDDEDDDEEDSERGVGTSRRRMGPYMISRMPGIRRSHILPRFRRPPPSRDDDDEEGEDVADDLTVNGDVVVDEEDDEDYGSGEDDPPYTAKGVVSRGRPPGRSAGQLRSARVALPSTENLNPEAENNSETEEGDDEDNATEKDDTKALADEEDDEEEVSDAEPVPADDAESGNETVSEDEDGKEPTVERPITHIPKATSPFKPSKPVSPTTTTHFVDVTIPLPKDIAPIAVAAAASSIMAGSSVLEPASPSPSSSASVSRASSRSPSPAPSAKDSECADPDDKETTSKPTKAKGKRKAPVSDKTQDKSEAVNHQSAASNSKTKPKELPQLDLDIEMREGDQDDLDRSAVDIEVDEPSPDDDLEIESDLQPAHRAEALDVLATIELKFALLRERVYVEKMENLAWEEALVNDASHPELIHLQKELVQRRDKRLELASRKRTYEVANVTKRRRVDEDATWSWWKVARDELQTDMISETNRKRRRLERERRAVERPQPVRRIPNPPTEALPPPSLRKIVKNFPFNNRRHNKTDYLHPGSKQLIYPELSTLSSDDIANDLNFLYQNRRHSYESHRHSTVNMNVQMAPPLHPVGYDQHGGEMPGGFGGVNRLPPPPQLVQYQRHGPPLTQPGGGAPPHTGYPSYNGPSGRHHPPPNPPPNVHNHSHNHNPYPNDLEMGGIINGPAHQGHQLLPHHPYFGSGSAGGAANVYPPISQHNGRRSISPVNLLPNGSGKPNGNWMGAGMGMGGFHSAPKSDWIDPRRNELDDEERALRERDKREREHRERDQRDRGHRERDHRDREAHDIEMERQREQYHMQQHLSQQHRQPPPSSGHPHLHPGPPPSIPHHHHHRAHHHHVVHHHHGQSQSGHASSSLPPGAPILGSHDYDDGRPHSGPSHPAEIINISSSKSIHLKGDEHYPPSSDYRDGRRQHTRGTSGPEDRERPLATPFVMAPSHGPLSSSGHLNGTSSPRAAWNPTEDNAFRMSSSSSAPAGYLSSHDGPVHSPGHRYSNSAGAHLGRGPPPVSSSSLQNSVGLSPPRTRPLPPPSPSASSSTYPNSNSHHSPNRYGPANRSPINHKMRPPSPLSSKLNAGPLPSPSVYNPSPSGLSGPGRTSTPTGHPSSGSHLLSDLKNGSGPSYPITSRTASPLHPFPSTSSHPNIATVLSGRPPTTNGADRDRERDRERGERDRDRRNSPRIGALPSKLSVPQLVDGH